MSRDHVSVLQIIDANETIFYVTLRKVDREFFLETRSEQKGSLENQTEEHN